VIGMLLGGVVTAALGWEPVFFVNVPLAGACSPIVSRGSPEL
jgi:hypothetical protein